MAAKRAKIDYSEDSLATGGVGLSSAFAMREEATLWRHRLCSPKSATARLRLDRKPENLV
jgi:hypothetical protein